MAAVAWVVRDSGPSGLTLAAVGRRAHLSAPALNQRFGSKTAMHAAFVQFITDRLNAVFEQCRLMSNNPIDCLHLATIELMRGIMTPVHMANYIAMLHHDLADAAHRSAMVSYRYALRGQVRTQLQLARELGLVRSATGEELDDEEVEQLVDTLVAVFEGATISWATDGEGPVADHVWRRVHGVLTPWLIQP